MELSSLLLIDDCRSDNNKFDPLSLLSFISFCASALKRDSWYSI